ncbi:MAG: glycosyltransferase [Lacisediminihabitans sp.]
MRIVHVANFYGPRSGGLRTTMHELGRGYLAAGHDFVMIVPGQRLETTETEFGLRMTVPSLPLVGTGYSFIPIERTVRRALGALAPDRIEVSDRLTLRRLGIWARKRGIPAVMFSHEKLSDWILKMAAPKSTPPPPGTPRPLADMLNQASLRNYDRIVCTTHYAAEEFERLLPGKVVRVPLGVDLELFTPQRWSQSVRTRYLGDGAVLLAHVGRLSPEKVPHRSIEALRALRAAGVDARLVIAGDGPLRARLERSAAGLPVTFVGFISDRGELATLLASADVSLNPGPIETFCLSALEALASGTPVVAAASSALPELIVREAGEVAGPSSSEFAAAIQRVLATPVENRRTAARERAAGYTWKSTVTAMLALHESLG